MMILEKSRLQAGQWEIVIQAEAAPNLVALYQGQPLEAPRVEQKADRRWKLSVALPGDVLSDGVHTVVLKQPEGADVFARMSVTAGVALSDELHDEVALLRAEMDLLKAAFRRHCAETQG